MSFTRRGSPPRHGAVQIFPKCFEAFQQCFQVGDCTWFSWFQKIYWMKFECFSHLQPHFRSFAMMSFSSSQQQRLPVVMLARLRRSTGEVVHGHVDCVCVWHHGQIGPAKHAFKSLLPAKQIYPENWSDFHWRFPSFEDHGTVRRSGSAHLRIH